MFLQVIFGIGFLTLIALLVSTNRRAINWRLILTALVLQSVLFLAIQYVPFINHGFDKLAAGFVNLLGFAKFGTDFVMGGLTNMDKYGFTFILAVVPIIIYFSALINICYHFGIIQRIVGGVAWFMRKTMRLSGTEALGNASNIFLGPSESPLVVAPYIKTMTNSELASIFIVGLANLSGSVLGAYISFLGNNNHAEEVRMASYLLTATFMNAMGTIYFAKIIFPETDFSKMSTEKVGFIRHNDSSLIDGIVKGALLGVKLGLAIVTVLLAVIPLIYLANYLLLNIGDLLHINDFIQTSTSNVFPGLSLEYMFGQVFRIFAFFMGVDWHETLQVGSLLGQKVVINEFVAYISMTKMMAAHQLSANSVFISTFALESFSNFSTVGIQLATFSILDSSRREFLAKIAPRALLAAILAGFMTATVAGFWHNLLG